MLPYLAALALTLSPVSNELETSSYQFNQYQDAPTQEPLPRGSGRRQILAQGLTRGYIAEMPMVCGVEWDFIRLPEDVNGYETITIHVEVPADPQSQATALAIAQGSQILIGSGVTVPNVLANRIRNRGCIPIESWYGYTSF